MGFFAQANKVFNGDEPTRQAKDHIDRDEAPELEPGECCTIDAEPQRLTNDHVRFNRFFIGEAPMEEINNGQDYARERNKREDEKTPARPDVGKGLCNEEI